MIKISAIPIFNDNYIWIFYDDVNKLAWAIDPGLSEPVVSYCQQKGLTLAGIVITHHHHDHTGGIGQLLQYARIPVYGPQKETIPYLSHPLSGGQTLTLSVGNFKVLDMPGHTLGHIAYFCETLTEQPVLFVGDTLFSAGCGRLFEGTANMMFSSLGKIKKLPDNTLIYCTHEYTLTNIAFASLVEPDNIELKNYMHRVKALRAKNIPSLPTSLKQEKLVNPFLRTSKPAVIESASSWKGKKLDSPSDVFAALRQWKDNI